MIWKLDPSHSDISFSVRHMGLATVRGTFEKFDVDVKTDEAGVPTAVRAEIDVSSISTGSADRDGHLRSADFFDVENHPKMVFESTVITKSGDQLTVSGNLTIRGVSHPVTLEAEFSGPVTDPWGNPRIAADATGAIDRTKWGLTWNQVLEAGSLLVGEKVNFNVSVQAVGQPIDEAKEAVGA